MTPDEHHEITTKLTKLTSSIATLSDRVGHESQDGEGGTGLYGRVMRTEAKVESLLSDRNMLRGAAAILVALGAFLVAGIKGWFAAVFPHGTHP